VRAAVAAEFQVAVLLLGDGEAEPPKVEDIPEQNAGATAQLAA
jgi:hypothetical protein